MHLETDRCIIRPFVLDDALHMYEMNLDEETMRYTGDVPFASVEEARIFLDNYINSEDSQYKKGLGRMTALRKTDKTFLGFVGLKDVDGVIDLGYRLNRKHWGKGYGTELAMAMVQYGFEELNLEKIIANVHEENIGSQLVAERCGMQIAYRFLWDDRLPGRFYTITNDEYYNRIS